MTLNFLNLSPERCTESQAINSPAIKSRSEIAMMHPEWMNKDFHRMLFSFSIKFNRRKHIQIFNNQYWFLEKLNIPNNGMVK